MQLTRWLSLSALVGGAGVVLVEPLLGWNGFATLTGVDTDLRVMGGTVALVGALTLLIGDRERKEVLRGNRAASE